SLIQNLTALDNRNTNLNSLTANVVVDGLYADNEGMTPPGTFGHADLGFYVGQQNFTARRSTISYFHEGYQFVGWSLMEQTAVGRVRNGRRPPSPDPRPKARRRASPSASMWATARTGTGGTTPGRISSSTGNGGASMASMYRRLQAITWAVTATTRSCRGKPI